MYKKKLTNYNQQEISHNAYFSILTTITQWIGPKVEENEKVGGSVDELGQHFKTHMKKTEYSVHSTKLREYSD